jgi:hypothetical protein
MAQVLNTLAHEIRTPLAVSQGYLKLYVDGRLTTPADQQRALQQTRDALGVIAGLCAEASKVSALSEANAAALLERIDAAALAHDLRASAELAGAEWADVPDQGARIATNAPKDLVRALAVMMKAAFDDDKSATHRVEFTRHDDRMIVRAGTPAALAALTSRADDAGATEFNVVRGGKGLSLIWASFVADRHGIQAWGHQDFKASIGFSIPLVKV